MCGMILLLVTKVSAQEAILNMSARIDSVYHSYAKKINTPGMVYGVVGREGFIHKGSLGIANVEKQLSADSKTAFRIASMTKSFVAMAVLQLRDRGKIRLDDPAYLYIPELKNQKYISKDAPAISIRNLMTHSAGFPEDNPWGDRQLDVTEEEMLKMFRKGISFSSTPQVAYEYSNMGFAMLGYIIKKVSGKKYEEYINQNILKPLGMAHTYWEFDDVPSRHLALGYRVVNGKWLEEPMLHAGAYGAMGGLITTLDDFGKYVSLHLSAWPPGEARESAVLKRSSLREMQQLWQFSSLNPDYVYPGGRACATVTGYGYGMRWLKDCEGRIMTGHSGGLPGFGSNWMILPEYGIGLVCLANVTYAPATMMNMHVSDTIIRAAGLHPATTRVSGILEQRKNELIRVIRSWDTAQARGIFAMNFFMDYFLDSLKKQSATVFNRAGKIIKVGDMVAENNLRGTFVMEGENEDVQVKFTLTPENPPLIQEYGIRMIKKKSKNAAK